MRFNWFSTSFHHYFRSHSHHHFRFHSHHHFRFSQIHSFSHHSHCLQLASHLYSLKMNKEKNITLKMKTLIICVRDISDDVDSLAMRSHFLEDSLFIENERSITQYINNELIIKSVLECVHHRKIKIFIRNEQYQRRFMKNERMSKMLIKNVFCFRRSRLRIVTSSSCFSSSHFKSQR